MFKHRHGIGRAQRLEFTVNAFIGHRGVVAIQDLSLLRQITPQALPSRKTQVIDNLAAQTQSTDRPQLISGGMTGVFSICGNSQQSGPTDAQQFGDQVDKVVCQSMLVTLIGKTTKHCP